MKTLNIIWSGRNILSYEPGDLQALSQTAFLPTCVVTAMQAPFSRHRLPSSSPQHPCDRHHTSPLATTPLHATLRRILSAAARHSNSAAAARSRHTCICLDTRHPPVHPHACSCPAQCRLAATPQHIRNRKHAPASLQPPGCSSRVMVCWRCSFWNTPWPGSGNAGACSPQR